MMLRTAILALLLLAASATAFGDADTRTLRHNPFTRPALGDESSGRVAAAASSHHPVLRATLVAGKRSLANVEGRLLGIGDQHEGYHLIRVGEGDATFTLGDQEITVTIGDGKDDTTNDD